MRERSDEWRTVWHGLTRGLGRKWAVHVLLLLAESPRGFNELRRALGGPTAKTLSKRLTELRCAGLVERHVEATSPPSTRYELTPAGEGFVTALRGLEREVEVVECECDDDCDVITAAPDRTAVVVAEGCC